MHRCGTLWLFWGGGGYNITAPNISGIVLQYVRRLVGWRRGSHLQVHILRVDPFPPLCSSAAAFYGWNFVIGELEGPPGHADWLDRQTGQGFVN